MESNFQLLMLSPNLLKSKIPMSRGGGLVETNFQILMLSSNSLESQIPMSSGVEGGGLGGRRFGGNQFPKVNLNFSKSSPEVKFPLCGGGGGGSQLKQKSTSKFQSQILSRYSYFRGGEGREGGKVEHGMHGIWYCHLACIWGELADFDTKFYNTF